MRTDQELEVKFYLSRQEEMKQKLAITGKLEAPRVHEVNLRLDTPRRDLAGNGSILRLRKDRSARVTYKGSGRIEGGATLRQELEVTVSDFDTAQHLLEALGFQVVLMYEKYRTTYRVGEVEVDLDELPMGDFIELEGPNAESIQRTAGQLGLDWERRILDSYTVLFEHARQNLGLAFRDLSFADFHEVRVTAEALGVLAGDEK